MIIIDYNGIALSNIIVQRMEIQEDLIRHMILNSIRMYNLKFGKKYGQVVLACDASSWRKEVFPQYKFKRKENRETSSMDWDEVFRIVNLIREEIKENFPYKVLHVQRCEADDIIGVLVEETQNLGKHEEVMIISADKDFIQLQKYNNVRQFSPMTKKFVEHNDVNTYMIEHILRGDSSDGVPNVLSPDNAFVDSLRQSPMTKKKIELYCDTSNMEDEVYRNYCRNRQMIDLSYTPQELKDQIISESEAYKLPHASKVLNYLIKKRCKMLIECVGEFL
jgi:hypothetical protein